MLDQHQADSKRRAGQLRSASVVRQVVRPRGDIPGWGNISFSTCNATFVAKFLSFPVCLILSIRSVAKSPDRILPSAVTGLAQRLAGEICLWLPEEQIAEV